MGELPAGREYGAMAAVFASSERVEAAVIPYAASVAIAAYNGPDNVVISGRRQEVDSILAELAAEGIQARALKVSHAFHSPLMDPMLDAFAQAAGEVHFAAPRLRLVSNVTGGLATEAQVTTPAYWRDHCRAPVQFAAAMDTLHSQGVDILLEVGPGATLIGMGERCLAGADTHSGQEPLWLASLKPPRGEWTAMLSSLAALYRAGAAVDWEGFDRPYRRQRLALPTYPFQRQRYWLPARHRHAQRAGARGDAVHPLLGRRLQSALAAVQYEAVLRPDDLAYLADHRVQGATLLPGAAFMAAGLLLGRQVLAGDSGERGAALEELLLLEPLRVEEAEERVVQWIATPQEPGAWLFECYSRTVTGEQWQLHARGRLLRAAKSAPPAADLSAIQAACAARVTAEEHYAGLLRHGLDFGPSLHGVTTVWRREGEALGHIALDVDLVGDAAGDAGMHSLSSCAA